MLPAMTFFNVVAVTSSFHFRPFRPFRPFNVVLVIFIIFGHFGFVKREHFEIQLTIKVSEKYTNDVSNLS